VSDQSTSQPQPPETPRRRWLLELTVLGHFLILAVLVTWPLLFHLADALPLGPDPNPTVPYASAWALWWTATSAAHGFSGYWNAPIFFPASATFAFSEAMPLLGILAAPLIWMGASAALAHNVILLMALTLNGWSAWRLCHSLGLGRVAAWGGGAMAVLLPYVQMDLGVLTLVPLFGIFWTLHALLAFARDPSLKGGLWLGAAWAATYLMCGQYGFFLALSAPWATLWLVRRRHFQWSVLGGVLVAAIAAAVLVAPLVTAQLRAARDFGLTRDPELARDGSATATAWKLTTWPQLVPFPGIDQERSERGLFPGTIKLCLLIAGLWWWRKKRGTWLFLVTLAALGALWAVLPRWELGGFVPFDFLGDNLPGFGQIRSYYRATALTQVVAVILAAAGLEACLHWARRWGRGRPWPAVAIAVLAIVAAAEIWPRGQLFQRLIAPQEWQGFRDWMADNVAPDEPLVHVPFPELGKSRAYAETSRWMYWATFHGHPLVNGYSSYFPPSYRRITTEMSTFPEDRAHRALEEIGVSIVLVRNDFQDGEWRKHLDPTLWRVLLDVPQLGLSVVRSADRPPEPSVVIHP
jgi:hypothetical protein